MWFDNVDRKISSEQVYHKEAPKVKVFTKIGVETRYARQQQMSDTRLINIGPDQDVER